MAGAGPGPHISHQSGLYLDVPFPGRLLTTLRQRAPPALSRSPCFSVRFLCLVTPHAPWWCFFAVGRPPSLISPTRGRTSSGSFPKSPAPSHGLAGAVLSTNMWDERTNPHSPMRTLKKASAREATLGVTQPLGAGSGFEPRTDCKVCTE